jgi:WD40 repeat protein
MSTSTRSNPFAQVWDLEKEECSMVLVPDQQDAVKSVNCVLPWGQREVITANNKGELHIFDTASGLIVATLHSHLRTILSLLNNPQNSTLADQLHLCVIF